MNKKYRDNYDSITWSNTAIEQSPSKGAKRSSFNLIKDIEPFRSPLDGKYVTSRSELREHEKKHNVRQIGNDWSGSTRPANWDAIKNVNN
jgi:hypothetical protein